MKDAQPSVSHGCPARVVACGIWRGSEIKVDARGVELRNLPCPWQCAWLLCAVVARHEDRGAVCTLFQLRALRNVSMPAVVQFTPRMCLFAIVLLVNNTQNYDVVKTRKALRTLILRCRTFFSLRRQCRHVSDCTSSDATKSCIQLLLSELRRLTMGADLPQFAQAGHRNRGLVICQEACMERLFRCSLI